MHWIIAKKIISNILNCINGQFIHLWKLHIQESYQFIQVDSRIVVSWSNQTGKKIKTWEKKPYTLWAGIS